MRQFDIDINIIGKSTESFPIMIAGQIARVQIELIEVDAPVTIVLEQMDDERTEILSLSKVSTNGTVIVSQGGQLPQVPDRWCVMVYGATQGHIHLTLEINEADE